ncbi:MAG: YcgN family cysteine cluster protein [Rhodoblastus sp.]
MRRTDDKTANDKPADNGKPVDNGKPAGIEPFWRKPLSALDSREWEALCDGCGRCCLVKLEDEDTGAIHFTDVACDLFEPGACRCRDYARRTRRVHDCVRLTPENIGDIHWLPPTCAYRLRREGRDLPAWHPLISGDPASVWRAGVSCHDKVSAFEEDVEIDDLPDFIVAWPGKWPKGAARPKSAPGPAKSAQSKSPASRKTGKR